MPTLEIQLLGDFRLIFDGTLVTALNSARLQSLLAYLVLHRDAPQSRQQLAFLFWPDSPESQARANLRNLIHALRQAMPHPDVFLSSDALTLQWRCDAPFGLDVIEFENAVARATSIQAWQDVVDLYRGDLLPSHYEDWVLAERDRLRQKFLEALEQLAGLLEEASDYHAAMKYVQRLLQSEPLREDTYRRLMRLHALSGDRAGVMRVYHKCSTVLDRELCVEPSAETRQAYEHFLRMPVPSPAADSMPPMSLGSPRSNLPAQLTSFIGRHREKGQVKTLVAEHRLVTLSGAGGVGKTRLALALAADLLDTFPDGVTWIDLAPLADPTLVAQQVASAMGLRELPGLPLLDTLVSHVREKKLLLVLDNCEHMVEAVGRLTETLLQAAPCLYLLVTSRESLRIPGEVVWQVPPLSSPTPADWERTGRATEPDPVATGLQYESVHLFVERAAAALPAFAMTRENALAVAQICGRLDGIPLAIELAAARINLLSVEQIAGRLVDRFRLLGGGTRTALPHHQTLRGAMDWSYRLLSKKECILFRRLSVFAGSFTIDAVEGICSGEGIEREEIVDLLSELMDKSLVTAEARGTETRMRLLETVRQYGRERLVESGEKRYVQARHLGYFLHLAEEAEPFITDSQEWLNRLEAANDDVRAALEFCKSEEDYTEAGLAMAGALWRFWHERYRLTEGREHSATLLNRPLGQATRTRARAKALNAAGALAYFHSDFAAARSLLEDALSVGEGLGDQETVASALHFLGNTATALGDYDTARSRYEASLAIRQEMGDKRGTARLLSNLGGIAEYRGDYAPARRFQQASLALFRELQDKSGIAHTLNRLGDIERHQGELARARELEEESVAICRDAGNQYVLAYALDSLGDVALARADYVEAARLYRSSLELFRQGGDKWGTAYSLEGFAMIEGANGRAARGAHLLGAAERIREEISSPLPPSYRPEHDACIAVICRQVDPAALSAAWAEGRAMSLDRAIEYAMQEPPEPSSP